MLFNSKFSKFGKGTNITATLNSNNTISIYYFDNGVNLKTVIIDGNQLLLKREPLNLGYNEIIKLNENLLITRIDKNIGIINNEQ